MSGASARRIGLATAAVTMMGLLVAPAATAGTDDSAPPEPVTVRLVSQTPWVELGGTFELVVDLSDLPDDASVQLSLRDRVRTRSEYDAAVTGDQLRFARFTGERLAVADLEDVAATEFRIPTRTDGPFDADRVLLPEPGVHPVELRVFAADGTRVGGLVSPLVLVPPPDGERLPLAAAFVADIRTERPVTPPAGTVELADHIARLEEYVTVLAEFPDVPLSIAAVPETVQALAASEGPAADVLVTLRSAAAGRQLVAMPYVPVDEAALLEAGLADELVRQLDRGENVLDQTLGTTPDPSVWIAGDSMGPAVAERLAAEDREAFVVGEGRIVSLDTAGDGAPTRAVRLDAPGSPLAAVADDILGFRLLPNDDPVLSAHHVLGELAVLALDEPLASRGAVIRVPGGSEPSVEAVRALLAGLAVPNDLVVPVTLDQWFTQVEVSEADAVGLRPAEPENLGLFADGIRSSRDLLGSYESVLGPVSDRARPLEDQVLLSEAEGLEGSRRRAHLAAARRGVEVDLDAVSISESRTITLTARTGTIPVTIRNDSGEALNVLVQLGADRLEFPDGDTVALRLDDELTRIDVSVRTRGSGSFPLRVRVTSPGGEIEMATTRMTVRSTAVSGVGLVLSVGALAFLVVWWARHWRDGRRDRRLVARDRSPVGPT